MAYAFDWTLDTVTTLGSIQDPHNASGRVVKVGLELLGIGTLFYGLATVAEFFVSGQLSGVLEERRMEKMIDSFNDHYIVCGFGRVGRQVVARPAGRRAPPTWSSIPARSTARRQLPTGIPLIESEASDDEVLMQAGIERAQAIIACVDSDAENIFITLTARELRADIFIIARASAEDSEKKLLRAGADRVISPYKTSGSQMARVALRPRWAERSTCADYRMEEIEVSPECEAVGRRIADVSGGAVIVAIRHPDGRARDPAAGADRAAGGRHDHRDGAAGGGRAARPLFQPPRPSSIRSHPGDMTSRRPSWPLSSPRPCAPRPRGPRRRARRPRRSRGSSAPSARPGRLLDQRRDAAGAGAGRAAAGDRRADRRRARPRCSGDLDRGRGRRARAF